MLYRHAKKLHTGDEIEMKKSGLVLTVVEVRHDVQRRSVYVLTNSGEWVHHLTFR